MNNNDNLIKCLSCIKCNDIKEVSDVEFDNANTTPYICDRCLGNIKQEDINQEQPKKKKKKK